MAASQSYSQFLLTQETAFLGRIAAILKDEALVPPGTSPGFLSGSIVGDVAAQPGISDAYHSALLAEREDAASADDVITDGALLSAVTAVVASIPAGEEG